MSCGGCTASAPKTEIFSGYFGMSSFSLHPSHDYGGRSDPENSGH